MQTHKLQKLQKALTDADINASDDHLLGIVEDFAVSENDRALMHKNSVTDPDFRNLHNLSTSGTGTESCGAVQVGFRV